MADKRITEDDVVAELRDVNLVLHDIDADRLEDPGPDGRHRAERGPDETDAQVGTVLTLLLQ